MNIEIYTGKYMLGKFPLNIEVTADHRGLTACRLLPGCESITTPLHNEHLLQAASSLESYFGSSGIDLDGRLVPDGTAFQLSVWHATMDIPYGQVRSYRWIAERIGNAKAVRAVAQALGANPLLLFVPCHRVVRHNGELGGFGCGLDWKRRLLKKEGIPMKDHENLKQYFE